MAKRENGGGTIRKVKGANGVKYYAYAPARYDYVDGERKCIREPLGSFIKKGDARDAIENYRRNPSPKYNYTMAMVYEEWKEVTFSEISKQTQYNYSAAWVQIREAWGHKIDIPVREITISDVKQVFDYWMEEHEVLRMGYGEKPARRKVGPLSKSALKKIKSTMKQMYDYAMAHHIVDTNLASLAKLPKEAAEGTKRAFTDLEFAKLEKNYRYAPGGEAVYVLCYTGFRVTEFCLLTKFSYDPKRKTLTGGIKTEAGENRVVPVHPKIQPIIERWYSDSKGPLFPRKDGKPFNKDSFRDQVWDPCMAALGLPDDLTPHSARHTCGTRLSAAGVPQEDIQAIMGHADFSVTANTYINQDISTLTQSMAKVM